MKINDFRGDLSDISAKTATLVIGCDTVQAFWDALILNIFSSDFVFKIK